MRISDWSSDVCSSDLALSRARRWSARPLVAAPRGDRRAFRNRKVDHRQAGGSLPGAGSRRQNSKVGRLAQAVGGRAAGNPASQSLIHLDSECGSLRSEEHTSELQSLMRISYAVFCLKKKNTQKFTNI